MQDKTINNALAALRKQGGSQGKLAEVLLEMRGVPLKRYLETQAFRRGGIKRLVLDALAGKPMTNTQLGALVKQKRPDITPRSAANRSYQSLLRLEEVGLVIRDGRLWGLT